MSRSTASINFLLTYIGSLWRPEDDALYGITSQTQSGLVPWHIGQNHTALTGEHVKCHPGQPVGKPDGKIQVELING